MPPTWLNSDIFGSLGKRLLQTTQERPAFTPDEICSHMKPPVHAASIS